MIYAILKFLVDMVMILFIITFIAFFFILLFGKLKNPASWYDFYDKKKK